MVIHRSIEEPIRFAPTWTERWQESDAGLIISWERGRQMAEEDPVLGDLARKGQLVVLPWKGGVEKVTKAKKRYGCFKYVAMWQGLRGEDLTIDDGSDLTITCSRTGVAVTFTRDRALYGEE